MQRNTLIISSNIINISHQFLRNNRYLLQILQQLSRRYFFFHSKIVSNTINIWNACSSVEYTIVKYQQEFFSLKIDLHTRGTKSGRERDYSADVIISREKNEKKDREREREREKDGKGTKKETNKKWGGYRGWGRKNSISAFGIFKLPIFRCSRPLDKEDDLKLSLTH